MILAEWIDVINFYFTSCSTVYVHQLEERSESTCEILEAHTLTWYKTQCRKLIISDVYSGGYVSMNRYVKLAPETGDGTYGQNGANFK